MPVLWKSRMGFRLSARPLSCPVQSRRLFRSTGIRTCSNQENGGDPVEPTSYPKVKPSFFKVYSGPGYPIDPKKEEARMFSRMMEFTCTMILPQLYNIKWNSLVCAHRGLHIVELPGMDAHIACITFAATNPSIHYQIVNAKCATKPKTP